MENTMENTPLGKKKENKLIWIIYWLLCFVISGFIHKTILKIVNGFASWLQKSDYHIILEVCS